MGDKSEIEWTDATWTPIRARNTKTRKVGTHCEKVSAGCANCYAERRNRWVGTGRKYTRGDRGGVEMFLDEKMLKIPLLWKHPRRVFVCSQTDLFADFVPDEWIDTMFAVMALSSSHTFQVLTKRAKRMREYFELEYRWAMIEGSAQKLYHEMTGDDPSLWLAVHDLPNVWLGVSAEDQRCADERIPELYNTPASLRFLSLEPLLEPISLGPLEFGQWLVGDSDGGGKIDWVIVGGESGHGARPMDIAWARDVVRQCRDAGVAVFVKQLGAKPFDGTAAHLPVDTMFIRHAKGGDPAEWPEDLRVREIPMTQHAHQTTTRAAGRGPR